MKRGYLGAVATLVGCTVGAGILGIPYVVSKAGFLTGLLDLLLIGIIMVIVSLYTGEITLRTKGNHQLTALAEKYLGFKGKYIITLCIAMGVYGALIAYGTGAGIALTAIFGGTQLINSLIFYAIFATIIYFGLKIFVKSELLLTSCIIIITLLLSVIAFFNINWTNLAGFSITNIYMPYGVMLFAYMGILAIPEMKQELKNNKKYLKRSIIYGISIVAIIYFLFTLAVVGVNGLDTTELATVGLGQALGLKMIILANLFALFAVGTSFLALGYSLKDLYKLDFNLKNNCAWLAVIILPLIVIITKLANFVGMLNITGVIADAGMLSLILIMHSKAQKKGNRKPEYTVNGHWLIKLTLFIIFIIGAIQLLL